MRRNPPLHPYLATAHLGAVDYPARMHVEGTVTRATAHLGYMYPGLCHWVVGLLHVRLRSGFVALRVVVVTRKNQIKLSKSLL